MGLIKQITKQTTKDYRSDKQTNIMNIRTSKHISTNSAKENQQTIQHYIKHGIFERKTLNQTTAFKILVITDLTLVKGIPW